MQMEDNSRHTLASLENFGSVQTCACCDHKIFHINFFNMSVRLKKEHFRCFVELLNDAMLKVDDQGEFTQRMEGMLQFYNYLGRCEKKDAGTRGD